MAKLDPESRKMMMQELQLRLVPVLGFLAIVMLLVAVGLSFGSLIALGQVRDDEKKLEVALDGVRANNVKIRNSEKRECLRIQRLRDQTNFTSGVIFEVLRSAAKSDSSRAPSYRRIISRVRYLRPTDCDRAVDDPVNYMPPDPIPYRDYLHTQGSP